VGGIEKALPVHTPVSRTWDGCVGAGRPSRPQQKAVEKQVGHRLRLACACVGIDFSIRFGTLLVLLLKAVAQLAWRDVRTIRSKRLRREVWLYAQGYCQHCRCYIPMDGQFEVDHIVAWSRGGQSTLGNSQLLCPTCNRRKGNRDDNHRMEAA
jgi:hypothetical protein